MHNSLLLGMFVVAICCLTVLFPMDMLMLYWGPLALFSWFDYLLNQAEHYGMREIRLVQIPRKLPTICFCLDH